MNPNRLFYREEINKTVWQVPEKYVNLKPIGSGAYGSVCSAINVKTGEKVAIKKLHRPFQSEIFSKRACRELRLLKHMKHENVIGLLDAFTPAATLEDFQDFYLVMPYMDMDLSKVKGVLSEDKIQFLVYQILKGLKYIHSAGIIHRVHFHNALRSWVPLPPFPEAGLQQQQSLFPEGSTLLFVTCFM